MAIKLPLVVALLPLLPVVSLSPSYLPPTVIEEACDQEEPESFNGNVRMNSDNTVEVFLIGIVQNINFTCGHWVRVCDVNEGAAAAVCRQMGSVNGGLPHILNEYSVESKYALRNVKCPMVKNYEISGELHILRCSYEIVANSQCTSYGINCYGNMYEIPYQGQVRLANGQHNQGILQIFWGYDWFNVCSTDLTGNCAPAVDSACRQLGYTGGSFKNAPRADSSKILGFTSQDCKENKYNYRCLYEQFDSAIPYQETCDTSAHIVCVFDPADSIWKSAGSAELCTILGNTTTSTDPLPSDAPKHVFFITTIVLSFIAGSLCLVLSVCVAVAIYRRPRRQGPVQPEDDLNALNGQNGLNDQ